MRMYGKSVNVFRGDDLHKCFFPAAMRADNVIRASEREPAGTVKSLVVDGKPVEADQKIIFNECLCSRNACKKNGTQQEIRFMPQ